MLLHTVNALLNQYDIHILMHESIFVRNSFRNTGRSWFLHKCIPDELFHASSSCLFHLTVVCYTFLACSLHTKIAIIFKYSIQFIYDKCIVSGHYSILRIGHTDISTLLIPSADMQKHE